MNPGARQTDYQSADEAAGAQAFFGSLPIEQGTESVKENGATVAKLVDGTTIVMYVATSTEGPSVQITRPTGSGIKVRF